MRKFPKPEKFRDRRALIAFNVAASIKMRKFESFDPEPLYRPAAFNVAASIKMRKWLSSRSISSLRLTLQCGRIYKDAEIRGNRGGWLRVFAAFNVAASIKMRKSPLPVNQDPRSCTLQCGRIYKDAEMTWSPSDRLQGLCLQCGRIYKDAEISSSSPSGRNSSIPSMWPHL